MLPWAALLASLASAQPTLTVNYPNEKASLPAARGTFILGNVQPPEAKLKINGQDVALYKNGGFLAYVPIAAGTFTFHCEAALSTATAVVDRRVLVAKALLPSPADAKVLEDDFTLPKGDAVLRQGDWLNVQVKATAGMNGSFKLKGVTDDIPLREQTPAGLYVGAYQIQPGDKANGAEVRFDLKGAPGRIKTTAPGHVTIATDSPRVGYAWPEKLDTAVVRTGPGAGYMLFLSSGTKILVDGQLGTEARVRLSDAETGYVDASNIKYYSAGVPPPQATLTQVNTSASADGAVVKLSLGEKVPYLVEQVEPTLLRVKLYYTFAYVNWMIYDPADTFVQEARWRQDATKVAEVEIRLKAPLWGYQAGYEGGSLKLDLRRAPQIAPAPENPLKGRLIVLDPGHNPTDPGRVAPMGSTERELNLKTAVALRDILEKEGAKVFLTRVTNDAEVSLPERVRQAVNLRADAFISLHNNALPDGANPFEVPHGPSVFYYHPMSLELGRKLHDNLKRQIGMQDEGLRYGNLYVARLSLMPAVLVESLYFIFPEQEAMLNDPAFQSRLAQALADGLRDFFAEQRPPVQARPLAPKPKMSENKEQKAAAAKKAKAPKTKKAAR